MYLVCNRCVWYHIAKRGEGRPFEKCDPVLAHTHQSPASRGVATCICIQAVWLGVLPSYTTLDYPGIPCGYSTGTRYCERQLSFWVDLVSTSSCVSAS